MTDMYVNAAGHGLTLASGQPLGIGEPGPADLSTDHDNALVDEGKLVLADAEAPAATVPEGDALKDWLDENTAQDVVAAVGDDAVTAARVAEAESARSKPRKSLLDLAPEDPTNKEIPS